jgi:hypothetical protein
MDDKCDLTVAEVLCWADLHYQRTGRWPTGRSGPVGDAPGETWGAIEAALREGNRGLPGADTLARLLERHRNKRNKRALPPLTAALILAWADAHRARTGAWPVANSGPVLGAPGETWNGVNLALVQGGRGLPGGTSLSRLLQEYRGVPMWSRRQKAGAGVGATG